MQLGRAAIVMAVIVWTGILLAQNQPPAETLSIEAKQAATWSEGTTNIIQLEGPVIIDVDHTRLSATRAVIWLTPVPGGIFQQQQVQVALIGQAKLELPQQQVTRSGDRLYVTATVKGNVRITAEQRVAQDMSDSPLYMESLALVPPSDSPASLAAVVAGRVVQRSWQPSAVPATQPASVSPRPRPPANAPVEFKAAHVQTVQSKESKVALVLSGGVLLIQHRPNGDVIELQAGRAVLFTALSRLRDLQQSQLYKRVEDAVQAAYLEEDVRITYTPAGVGKPEQRLNANRIYYEFSTDRAVMTDAVIHSVEPQRQIPVIIRADTMRQLSLGEYNAQDVQLSTSAFATPSYSVAMSRAYVRQDDTGDDRYGTVTTFSGQDLTINAFGIPFFYLPSAGGTVTEQGAPLRNIRIESSSRFGFGIITEWGLFESLGSPPPRDLDLTYSLGYLSDRGPVEGINARYHGGLITDTTRDPWNFEGQVESLFVQDHGTDEFGGNRADVEPLETLRGSALWEHQHFFPSDWQMQLRAGWVSDPTFLEEYRPREFFSDMPHDMSAYFKRQRDTEALTFLVQIQPNGVVTTSDLLEEGVEVERLPEVGYHRIGDSLLDDSLTFFSNNTLAGLRFNRSDATPSELGFTAYASPGLPSIAQTGSPTATVYRGDFRQEVDWPFTAGQFRVVPYVLTRTTGYTDSPAEDAKYRIFTGTGIRVTTAFWKVDDQAASELFDIHRIRHVVEPELNVFTSAQSVNQDELFHYDEQVDEINDITAVQLALHQRWQTKRGGPGHWRSVDFLTLNTELNAFANQPPDAELNPTAFRGLYFISLPEASVPRNSVNADLSWRISDTTAILADAQYNIEDNSLATASVGVAVRRGERLSYFVGTRYVELLNSNITSLVLNYQLSRKYDLALAQSFDLSTQERVSTAATVRRHFDRFDLSFTVYTDSISDDSGFRVNLVPHGIGTILGTDTFSSGLQR